MQELQQYAVAHNHPIVARQEPVVGLAQNPKMGLPSDFCFSSGEWYLKLE